MDFLKILKSFEEFVYEALLWFILLPKTLGRILWSPRRMCDVVAAELTVEDEKRFSGIMSPPLLLILCVLIAHFVDLGVRPQEVDASGSLAGELFGSEQNMLLYRTMAFGLWALAGSAYLLLRSGVAITRESLRAPFYEQCYLVSPFALVVSIGTSLLLAAPDGQAVASILVLLAALWFLLAQLAWVRHRTRLDAVRSGVAAVIILLLGSAANFAVGLALGGGGDTPPAAIETDVGNP